MSLGRGDKVQVRKYGGNLRVHSVPTSKTSKGWVEGEDLSEQLSCSRGSSSCAVTHPPRGTLWWEHGCALVLCCLAFWDAH